MHTQQQRADLEEAAVLEDPMTAVSKVYERYTSKTHEPGGGPICLGPESMSGLRREEVAVIESITSHILWP